MAAVGGNVVLWFTYTGLDGEVIPHNATHIIVQARKVRARAFYGHRNIVKVICHDHVEMIEQEAFGCCSRLRRVIMRGVKKIVGSAFHCCHALENVECDNLEIIREYAFSWCESLRSINLPSARILERGAFGRCDILTNAKFGSKLERIDVEAFYLCDSLERITIPLKDGLFNHDDIFQGCDDLHKVDLVEGELHETIAALHLEEWRNDMNEEIDSINKILPNTPSGGWDSEHDELGVDDGDPGEKAQEIRRWIRSVLRRLDHYKTEHHKLLKEATTLLELALWKAKLDENDGGNLANEGLRMTRSHRKRAREEICVTSGADVVIKNVLPFLQLLEKEDDSIIYV